MTDMDLTVTGIVVGSLLPNVIALVIRPGWRPERKGLVAFGICLAAGLLIAVLEGRFSGRDLAASAITVLVISQVMYRTLWHPSGIGPAIEGYGDSPPGHAPGSGSGGERND